MPAPLARSRRPGAADHSDLYERDFHEWTRAQAEILRRLKPANLDWENLSEEIETLGRNDRRSIESNLGVILLHLLKWQYQPEKRKSGWRSTIIEHRARILKLIDESPSLKIYPAQVLAEEYQVARERASDETDLPLDRFPDGCPYAIAHILDQAFYPDRPTE